MVSDRSSRELTDLDGYLRFRSGDHAVVMDGTRPSLATAQLAQKPTLTGFLASVQCNIVRKILEFAETGL